MLLVAKAQIGGAPRASNDKQPSDAESPEERPATAQKQDAEPGARLPILDPNIELGKWADERMEEARKCTLLSRSGHPQEKLREQFPKLFSEVVDKLAEPKSSHFFQAAEMRKITADELLDFIGDAKCVSGHTLKQYRTKYRKHKQAPKTE